MGTVGFECRLKRKTPRRISEFSRVIGTVYDALTYRRDCILCMAAAQHNYPSRAYLGNNALPVVALALGAVNLAVRALYAWHQWLLWHVVEPTLVRRRDEYDRVPFTASYSTIQARDMRLVLFRTKVIIFF